jgi:hypothetical protein
MDNLGQELIFLATFVVVFLLIAFVIFGICLWRIFIKAGQKGIYAFIPVYNLYILLILSGRKNYFGIYMAVIAASVSIALSMESYEEESTKMIASMFSLGLNIFSIYLNYIIFRSLARSFGQDNGFAIGLLFLSIIFFPILAFGKKYQYVGPDGVLSADPYGINEIGQ